MNHAFFFSDKPENVQLEISAVDNKACPGDVISMNCSADANPSVISYQLFQNDTAILDTSGRWSKALPTGVFIFKCVAHNTVGRRQSVNVTVTIDGEENGQILVPILNIVETSVCGKRKK